MADDIKIVIGVEDADVLKTIRNHEILERRVEELTKEYAKLDKLKNKGKLSAQSYAKAVQQLDRQIDTLTGALKKGGTAVDQLATGMNLSGKAARRNEIAFQQAGYQVQDFIVQVQGGTNPLIAFSQQASQLAGFFAGPWGAMIGLGIAAASSLAMAFLATGEDAENLGKNLDDLESKLDDFNSAVKASEEKVSSFADTMARISDVQIAEAWSNLGDAAAGSFEASFMAKIGAFLGANLWTGFETWADISGRLAGDSFAEAFGESAEGLIDDKLLDQIGQFIKDQNVAMLDSTIQDLSAFQDITPEGARFLEYLIDARDAANGFTEEIKSAARELAGALDAGEDISKLNLSIPIEDAKKVAEQLADYMGLSLRDALGIVNLARGAVAGGRGGDPRQFTYLDEFRKQLKDTKDDNKPKKPTAAAPKTDPLKALQDRIALEQDLLGKTQEYVRVRQALGESYDKVEPKTISRLERQIALINEAKEAEKERKMLMQTVERSFESGFMSIIDGTQSVKDAFRSMARDIIAELYRILVVKQLVRAATGFFGFADGGVFQGGSQVQAFADGGVVGGPTFFPMSGGKTGLMGEAGPEAIMPLKRGKNGKLGVEASGESGNVTVVQNFSFSANGDDSVKKIIAQEAPKIAQMTQQQILESRKRGGSFRKAFG